LFIKGSALKGKVARMSAAMKGRILKN
jgi:hypothetical protein